MSKRKKKLPTIKKHYLIPLFLCGIIIVSGVVMTCFNQSGQRTKSIYKIGQYAFSHNSVYIIKGPQVILLGSALSILLLIYWSKTKNNN